MPASELLGRAENFRWSLEPVWERLRGPLLQAQTEEEVVKAFEENAGPHARKFVPALAPFILRVLRDPRFPKREPKLPKRKTKSGAMRRNPRIVFLADSLAGMGEVSPRRSRDIVAQERARIRARTKHRILRYEYYIECSCGYKGPARDNACRKCGAQILHLRFLPFGAFSP
jgi:hypothetical protein